MSWSGHLVALRDALASLETVASSRVLWSWLTGQPGQLPDPPDGVWLLPQLLPVDASPAELGRAGATRHQGLITVSVYAERGRALETLGPVFEEVATALRRRNLSGLRTLDPRHPEQIDEPGAWARWDIQVPCIAYTHEEVLA